MKDCQGAVVYTIVQVLVNRRKNVKANVIKLLCVSSATQTTSEQMFGHVRFVFALEEASVVWSLTFYYAFSFRRFLFKCILYTCRYCASFLPLHLFMFFWRSCLLQPTVVLCPPFSQQTYCSRLKIAFHASAPVSTITTVPTSNCSLLEEKDRLDQCAAHTLTVSPPQNCTPTMWKLQICSCRGEEEALWWVFRWSLQWQQWFPSNGDFIPLT